MGGVKKKKKSKGLVTKRWGGLRRKKEKNKVSYD
jgi:hypothetical protein